MMTRPRRVVASLPPGKWEMYSGPDNVYRETYSAIIDGFKVEVRLRLVGDFYDVAIFSVATAMIRALPLKAVDSAIRTLLRLIGGAGAPDDAQMYLLARAVVHAFDGEETGDAAKDAALGALAERIAKMGAKPPERGTPR